MMKQGLLAIAGLAAVGLAGCETGPKAPTDRGVCYQVTIKGEEPPKFNKVDENVDIIENCVGRLEALRVRFLRMGGSRSELVGAYQGKFIFIDRAGVKYGDSLTSGRFFAFTRGPDGTLVIPGAIYAGPATGQTDSASDAAQPEQK